MLHHHRYPPTPAQATQASDAPAVQEGCSRLWSAWAMLGDLLQACLPACWHGLAWSCCSQQQQQNGDGWGDEQGEFPAVAGISSKGDGCLPRLLPAALLKREAVFLVTAAAGGDGPSDEQLSLPSWAWHRQPSKRACTSCTRCCCCGRGSAVGTCSNSSNTICCPKHTPRAISAARQEHVVCGSVPASGSRRGLGKC